MKELKNEEKIIKALEEVLDFLDERAIIETLVPENQIPLYYIQEKKNKKDQ